MRNYVISFLNEMAPECGNNDIVSIGHMMETTNHTIVEKGFVAQAVTISEKRISALLVITNHDRVRTADFLHWSRQ